VIVHVVLFQPRGDLSAESRRALVLGLQAAAAGIPSVTRLRVGRRVTHGRPGYEQAMADDYSYAVLVEVEDLDGLKAYLAHPAHEAIGQHFTTSSTRALAYDYDMADAAEAVRLLETEP
jgi:hypothetical protein